MDSERGPPRKPAQPVLRTSPVRTEAVEVAVGDSCHAALDLSSSAPSSPTTHHPHRNRHAALHRRRTSSLMTSHDHVRVFLGDEHNDVHLGSCLKCSFRMRLACDLWLLAAAAGQVAYAAVQLWKNAAQGINAGTVAVNASLSGSAAYPFGTGAEYPDTFATLLLVVALALCAVQLVLGTALRGLLAACPCSATATAARHRAARDPVWRLPEPGAKGEGLGGGCGGGGGKLGEAGSRGSSARAGAGADAIATINAGGGCWRGGFNAWALRYRAARLNAQIVCLLAAAGVYLHQLHAVLAGQYPAGLDPQLQAVVAAFSARRTKAEMGVVAAAWASNLAALFSAVLSAFVWVEHRRTVAENSICLQEKFVREVVYGDGAVPVSARLSRILDLSDRDIGDGSIQQELLHQETHDDGRSSGDEDDAATNADPGAGVVADGLSPGRSPSSTSTAHRRGGGGGAVRRRSLTESVDAIIQRRSWEVINKTKHVCRGCQKDKAACVYLPCRHFVHCRECALCAGARCPECNEAIAEPLHIFQ